jgi:DNA polymerase III sliding clamp (beta) subunit (PCNA family)
MLLNRNNLEIAKFALKESSRYALDSVYITPADTVATDDIQLVIVSTPDMPEDGFPAIEGFQPCGKEFESFLIDQKSALDLSASIPRKSLLPVLEHVQVGVEESDPPRRCFAVTDLDNPQIRSVKKQEGVFPDYKSVIPDSKKAKFAFYMNPELLAKAAAAVTKFLPKGSVKDKKAPSMLITFYGEDKPLRLDALNPDTGQRMTFVIMPMVELDYDARDFHQKKDTPKAEASKTPDKEEPEEEW